ncbi:MAG: CDP-glycerol glycerophosphotransferase family protein [Deltaproteobacteria bacterium]|nr:CDP-glycerol glycerophosphotransferase family protein [Deltaproteobacteria bacterium]
MRPVYAYVCESGFQHAHPIAAMLRVLDAPVFTTGPRISERLGQQTEVIRCRREDLPEAIAARKVDVLLSTSQGLAPVWLRARRPGLKVVFLGHGESDKTHGHGPRPRPSWHANPVNRQFDLMLIASHRHFEQASNERKELVGSLKHDLYVHGGLGERRPEPDWVLWAPGWGRHCGVEHWLDSAVTACAEMGLRLVIHFHPMSYQVDLNAVHRAFSAVLAHRHVRVARCLQILDLMSRCSVMLADVSSANYDWLFFDRPMIFTDHPGLRFPAEKTLFDIDHHVRDAAALAAALQDSMKRPERNSLKRRQALSERYFQPDGHAAERCLEATERWWGERWSSAC